MAICLECECKSAHVLWTRFVKVVGDRYIARFVDCPTCGLMRQDVRSLGPAVKRDLPRARKSAERLPRA